jgi:uncharacterized LabA/DUF88 family protein
VSNNYIFFDGSSLIAEIRTIQDAYPRFKERRLLSTGVVDRFAESLDYVGAQDMNSSYIGALSYRRATFYFADGDSQVERFVKVPDRTTPRLIRDVEFKFCGRKLPKSAEYDDWLASVPLKFHDRCQKSEKGVDISICCDALGLAALRSLDRLILLTNDSDYIPLCEKLKALGVNVSLIQLSNARAVNKDLVNACDSYMTLQDHLDEAFD